MKEREQPEPPLFDQMNAYLRREAPEGIPDPTVEGIAERMGIPKELLNTWLEKDKQFKEEMTRLKDFQANDPLNEGNEFDYFIHASGVEFILEETWNRRSI